MAFQPKRPEAWRLSTIDPNRLSDEQAEFYYQLAKELGRNVEDFPLGSMGRYTVASAYIRFRQRQLRMLTDKPKPEF